MLRALRPCAPARVRVVGSSLMRRAMATQSDSSAKPPSKRAFLVLEDGTRLPGYSFGADAPMSGELVFSTGMVGYTESLTDPSYRRQVSHAGRREVVAKRTAMHRAAATRADPDLTPVALFAAAAQILTLTTPMVGNYGVPNPDRLDKHGLPKGFESYKIHAAGLVVQDYSHHYSHWDAHFSLGDWLKREGIPAIAGIDTRMLTKKIRSRGAMPARIEFEVRHQYFNMTRMTWT